jgi:glutamate 5-kinase
MGDAVTKRMDAMPTFQVAHLRREGQDVIIVPVDRSFGKRSLTEQARIQEAFQRSAAAADMQGVVVPVWEDASGRLAFRAPPPWHDFFRSIDMVYVATALNRSLSLEPR